MKISRHLRIQLCVITCCIAFASLAFAQTAGTGALAGTVTDSTGAVIPNASVTATNNDTGQVRNATTGADGGYRFALLPPGTYKVTFSANGFRNEEAPAVSVAVTETPVLNETMQLGTQAEQVTVEANVETVQTTSSTLGTVVNAESTVALPLTTRNYTNLLALSAGANAAVPNATALGRGNLELAVNGAPTNLNNFQMDGVSVVNYGSSGALTEGGTYATFGIPNPDALEEFKIQTSLYDAGYGRNAGASVNVITKSGTNSFHGTAFEFFRNTALNANDFFRNRTCGQTPAICASAGGDKLVLNQNQFGGVIGGPIKKDKLFFFSSYQQTWQKNGVASQGYATGVVLPAIPTGPRNTPAFQAALGAAFCNAPTAAGGIQVACDGSNINPIALKFLQAQLPGGGYYMPGSSTGAPQAVNYSIPAYDKEYQGMMNLDYVINSKNTLISRFFKSQEPQLQSFEGTTPVPGTTGTDPFFYDDGVIKLTTIVSNNMVNELRTSIQRAGSDYYQQHPTSSLASNIYPNVAPGTDFLSPTETASPVIGITGAYSVGGSSAADETVHNTQWQFADQISWTHGKHTIRAGFEKEYVRWGWIYLGLEQGIENFQTFSDFLVGLPGNCGVAVAGLCNGGTASNISNTSNYVDRSGPGGIQHGYRASDANAFVQDDFRVNSRLTLNLGLRWEYDGLPTDKFGNLTGVWTSLIQAGPAPITTQVVNPGTYVVPTGANYCGYVVPSNYDTKSWEPLPPCVVSSGHNVASQNGVPWDDFAPRFGFAWQPLKESKLAVRGGFGFFYNRIDGNTLIHTVEEAPPYAEKMDQSGVGNSFSSEAAPFQTVPFGVFPARWVNFTPGLNAAQESSSLTEAPMFQNYLTPLTYSWNFNVQYQLAQTWLLEVGYAGSHGIHQAEAQHVINEPELASAADPVNGLTTNTVANAPLRVPYLGFGVTNLQYSMTDGSYKFNSLQVTLRKQLSHGLTLQAAYSWSRAFSDLLGPSGMNSGDPLNAGQQYGLNTAYRPQRLVINYSYQIPGSNLKGVAGKALGGWSLSGVTTIQDGPPLLITDNRGGSIYGMNVSSNVVSRAEMAPGETYADIPTAGGVEARLGGSSDGPGYLNSAAFCNISLASCLAPIGNGTGWGNVGIGPVLGPGQFNFDATLAKVTRVGGIHENATLQFRAEFYNFFNHPQFSNPAVAYNAGTFGQITSTSVNPRLIQLALKYVF